MLRDVAISISQVTDSIKYAFRYVIEVGTRLRSAEQQAN